MELLVLILLPDEGLHHPDGGDVLLDAGVEVVVLGKDLLEQGQGDRMMTPRATTSTTMATRKIRLSRG